MAHADIGGRWRQVLDAAAECALSFGVNACVSRARALPLFADEIWFGVGIGGLQGLDGRDQSDAALTRLVRVLIGTAFLVFKHEVGLVEERVRWILYTLVWFHVL